LENMPLNFLNMEAPYYLDSKSFVTLSFKGIFLQPINLQRRRKTRLSHWEGSDGEFCTSFARNVLKNNGTLNCRNR
jgi:hypothetical protein